MQNHLIRPTSLRNSRMTVRSVHKFLFYVRYFYILILISDDNSSKLERHYDHEATKVRYHNLMLPIITVYLQAYVICGTKITPKSKETGSCLIENCIS